MSARADTGDYRQLFLDNVPFLDLRSPGEFVHGAFPTAHNLPLMSDEERAAVGTCYKRQGQAAAIALGHRLVSGAERERRLTAWCDFARRHPGGYLYCWRGGLRSETVQQWLAGEGIAYPRVSGGYKALRRFLLDELQRSLERARLVLISGRTGTGKTRVVEALERAVDLERLARRYAESYGPAAGAEEHRQRLLDGLDRIRIRIRKRLGGERHQAIRGLMQRAFTVQARSGDTTAHRAWIAALLETYYDPMYTYQLSRRSGKRLFSGDRAAVIAWARAR